MVLEERKSSLNAPAKKQVKNVLVLFIIFFLTKETKFMCFLCREERSKWKCSGVGMEQRIRRMNGGREVHRSSGQIFSPLIFFLNLILSFVVSTGASYRMHRVSCRM